MVWMNRDRELPELPPLPGEHTGRRIGAIWLAVHTRQEASYDGTLPKKTSGRELGAVARLHQAWKEQTNFCRAVQLLLGVCPDPKRRAVG